MWKKATNFDNMITPSIIKILFWIGIAASIISALVMIGNGLTVDYGGGVLVLSGIITLILGPIFTRVSCELLIVIFKIYYTLKEINENQ